MGDEQTAPTATPIADPDLAIGSTRALRKLEFEHASGVIASSTMVGGAYQRRQFLAHIGYICGVSLA